MPARQLVLKTAAALLLSHQLHAALLSTSTPFMAQGPDAVPSNGGYVPTTLGRPYQFYIEVPPGLNLLVVEIFDADVGRGGAQEAAAGRDRARTGFNTSFEYRLYRPDGTLVNTLSGDALNGTDNAWAAILHSTGPQYTVAGHWLLEVEGLEGDDINAFSIRAHDGNSGFGGIEIPIYFDSFAPFGVNENSTRTYTTYAWVTSGCSWNFNDYDSDDPQSNSSVVLDLPIFTVVNNNLSGNAVWQRTSADFGSFSSLYFAHGLWPVRYTIGAPQYPQPEGNYADVFFGTYYAPALPLSQPFSGAIRGYLHTDWGVAPAKPLLAQYVTRPDSPAAGPFPLVVGQASTIRIDVHFTNPTAYPIQFLPSAAHSVQAHVAGGTVVYGSGVPGLSAQVTQGSIISEPPFGGSGDIIWNPGTVAPGTTAKLWYYVQVTPNVLDEWIPVTGSVESGNGTRAFYLDETGNLPQPRAHTTYGPLCPLQVRTNWWLAIFLQSFDAVRAAEDEDFAEVRWVTLEEVSNAGFHLYRAEFDPTTGEWRRGERLNSILIPSSADSTGGGASYSFIDPVPISERPGPRGYFLVDVEIDGTEAQHGPAWLDLNRNSAPHSGVPEWSRY